MRDENPEKFPTRMGNEWTMGEHSIAISLLKGYKTYNEIAHILKRTDSAISSHLRLVIREYHFVKKYTVDEIMSKFNFTKRKYIERTIENTTDKHIKSINTTKYKNWSSFAEVMDMLDKVKKVQMENGTFDMEAYAKLVDYSVKPFGVNIFPK